jgi:hypothetical protein
LKTLSKNSLYRTKVWVIWKKVGTVHANLFVGSRLVFAPVVRIRDVYPGSRILIFTHPGSRISDPKTAKKEWGEQKI